MKLFWRNACFLLFCMPFISCGCTGLFNVSSGATAFGEKDGPGINIVSWNLETFFDAVSCGTEYEDFIGSKSKWTEEKYRARLDKLCSYMNQRDADIYCFVEVENTAVVQDIANTLQSGSVSGSRWPYSCFAKDEGSALGCAIFSKYEPEDFFVHSMDFRTAFPSAAFNGYEAGTCMEQPSVRPLMEMRFSTPELQGQTALFVCHWKSKSGGALESEVWRNCQEAVLADKVAAALNDGCGVVVCGDMNRDLSEFQWSQKAGMLELRGFFCEQPVTSPWFGCQDSGSYYYKNEWSRIDHFFTAGGLTASSFRTDGGDGRTSDAGYPASYDVWTGTGVSDHLPLMCRICAVPEKEEKVQ